MKFQKQFRGTCASGVEFELNDGLLSNIRFFNGCSGNTQGVAALAEGQPAQLVIDKVKGIHCGFKKTSCPDQFAKALEEALKME